MFLTDTQVLMFGWKLWLCFSLSRLRRIQSLLSKQSNVEKAPTSSSTTAAAPDTLLCILGTCLVIDLSNLVLRFVALSYVLLFDDILWAYAL